MLVAAFQRVGSHERQIDRRTLCNGKRAGSACSGNIDIDVLNCDVLRASTGTRNGNGIMGRPAANEVAACRRVLLIGAPGSKIPAVGNKDIAAVNRQHSLGGIPTLRGERPRRVHPENTQYQSETEQSDRKIRVFSVPVSFASKMRKIPFNR